MELWRKRASRRRKETRGFASAAAAQQHVCVSDQRLGERCRGLHVSAKLVAGVDRAAQQVANHRVELVNEGPRADARNRVAEGAEARFVEVADDLVRLHHGRLGPVRVAHVRNEALVDFFVLEVRHLGRSLRVEPLDGRLWKEQ